MTARTARIDELLRQEIGQVLARDLSDPAIGFVTVTDVETTPDLSHAQVHVSVIGRQDERSASVAALQRAMPRIRHELGKTLHLRRIPELHVRLDETAERGTRILHILDELAEGHVPDPVAEGEPLPTPVPRLHQPGDAEEPPTEESASEVKRDRPRRGRAPSSHPRGASRGGNGPAGGRVSGRPHGRGPAKPR